eukprot:3157646-Rhodomonas_salina.2
MCTGGSTIVRPNTWCATEPKRSSPGMTRRSGTLSAVLSARRSTRGASPFSRLAPNLSRFANPSSSLLAFLSLSYSTRRLFPDGLSPTRIPRSYLTFAICLRFARVMWCFVLDCAGCSSRRLTSTTAPTHWGTKSRSMTYAPPLSSPLSSSLPLFLSPLD